MAFGCFAGFIAANQAPSAFDVVRPRQRASAVGVLNLVGSTISGLRRSSVEGRGGRSEWGS